MTSKLLETPLEKPHEKGTLVPSAGYSVQLLLSAGTPIVWETLAEVLRKLDPTATVQPHGIAFPAGVDGQPTSVLKVGDPQSGVGDVDALEAAFSQTWDWPDADHALSHALAEVVVEEASVEVVTDRFERLRRFNIVLRALVEQLPVVAIHWRSSQRLVDPRLFIESLAHGGSVTDHAVNVRLYNVPDGAPDERIMDSIGLDPFGLPDLQCHFIGLDPMAVGQLLMSYAEYLFDKGDVLNDDDLVRGVQSHEEWVCRREHSLAPPERPVVDIRPDEQGVAH